MGASQVTDFAIISGHLSQQRGSFAGGQLHYRGTTSYGSYCPGGEITTEISFAMRDRGGKFRDDVLKFDHIIKHDDIVKAMIEMCNLYTSKFCI